MAHVVVGAVQCLVCCCSIVIIIMVLFTLQAFTFWQELAYAEQHYVRTHATVIERALITETCTRRVCTGTGRQQICHDESYTCYHYSYYLNWTKPDSSDMIFATVNTPNLESIDILETDFPYDIDDLIPVWYDPPDPEGTARLVEPVSGGWFIGFVVSVLIDVSLVACFVVLFPKARRQDRHDSGSQSGQGVPIGTGGPNRDRGSRSGPAVPSGTPQRPHQFLRKEDSSIPEAVFVHSFTDNPIFAMAPMTELKPMADAAQWL